jgi:hypothetical protein
VSRITAATEITVATPGIDFANNTLTTVYNNSNKLVPDRPIKPRIPTRDLEVGITDSRQHDAHERLTSMLGFVYIFD